jgi:hypothetical protein
MKLPFRNKRNPYFPDAFLTAFDSIATWLFEAESPQNKILTIKPACVYQEKMIREMLLNQLPFKRDGDKLNQVDSLHLRFNFISKL